MKKILLVDDDRMNGILLQKRLQKREFECDYVESGQACFDSLKSNQYGLVLLDIMMPNISGIDVLKKVRETQNNFELPIIMVTAKDEASDVVDALKLGANDYLTTPVNIDIAEARINTQLQIQTLLDAVFRGDSEIVVKTFRSSGGYPYK